MKKLLCLLCCLCLILCSCGSDAEPPETPSTEKRIGKIYEENGIIQSALITFSMAEQSLQEPVVRISCIVHNESDYDIIFNHREDIFLEIFQEGEWVSPPLDTSTGKFEQIYGPVCLKANTSVPPDRIVMNFGQELTSYDHYEHHTPLTEGLYRVRLPFAFVNPPDDVKNVKLEVVAYFTVEPAA